ncbi:MAG TPA: periplasmic heavy metal sensor, partial [Firmicutes bacterium]|nr:periplasmic heavy metal sensor [Bacillota bacterium]
MKTRQVIVSTIMAASLLASGAGLAQAGPGKSCDKGGKHAACQGEHQRGARPMQRLMEKLELDQAQRDKVTALMEEHRAQIQDKREAMHEIQRKMREAATAETYDAEQVN